MQFLKRYKYQLIIFFLAFLQYVGTIPHDYAWDDHLVITRNEYTLKGLDGIGDIFTKRVYTPFRNSYRPIVQASFALEQAFFKGNPHVSHFINVILYALLCLLIFQILRLIFPRIHALYFFIVTVLFVVHPLHVEVVANIKSRDELMAFLFALLGLRTALKIATDFKWNQPIIAMFFFGLALLCKISAITILPLIVVSFYYMRVKIDLAELNRNALDQVKTGSKKIFDKTRLGLNFGADVLKPVLIFFVEFLKQNAKLLLGMAGFLLLLLGFVLSRPFITWLALLPWVWLTFLWVGRAGRFMVLLLALGLWIWSIAVWNPWISILAFSASAVFFSFNAKDFRVPVLVSIMLVIFYIDTIFKLRDAGFWTQFDGISVLALVPVILILYIRRSSWKFMLPILIAANFIFMPVRKAIYEWEDPKVSFFAFIQDFSRDEIEKEPTFFTAQSDLIIGNDSITNLDDKRVENIFSQALDAVNPDYSAKLDLKATALSNVLIGEKRIDRRAATIVKMFGKYFQLLLIPHPLVHHYGYNQFPVTNWADLWVWLSLLILIGGVYYFVKFFKKRDPSTFGIVFFITTVSVYSHIIQNAPDTLADRFMFMPSLGFLLFVVFALIKVFGINPEDVREKETNKVPKKIRIALVVLTVVLGFLMLRTFVRNDDWHDDITLSRSDIKYMENNAVAHMNMGYNLTVLYNRAEFETDKTDLRPKIEKHLRRALEIYPDMAGARIVLGKNLVLFGDAKGAMEQFQQVMMDRPNLGMAYFYAGILAFDMKDYRLASKYLEKTVELNPDIIDSYPYLGWAYFSLGDFGSAKAALSKGAAWYTANSRFYTLIAHFHFLRGENREAVEFALLANGRNPADTAAIRILADAYEKLGEHEKSIFFRSMMN